MQGLYINKIMSVTTDSCDYLNSGLVKPQLK